MVTAHWSRCVLWRQAFLLDNKLRLVLRSHEGPDARDRRNELPNMLQGHSLDHETSGASDALCFTALLRFRAGPHCGKPAYLDAQRVPFLRLSRNTGCHQACVPRIPAGPCCEVTVSTRGHQCICFSATEHAQSPVSAGQPFARRCVLTRPCYITE